MLSSFLVSLYFTALLLFSFVNHPISYCLLLLASAVSVAGYVYSLLGVCWYLVLFCLVYIGGVYILFIFVSIHNPNPNPVGGGSNLLFSVVFFMLFLVFFSMGQGAPLFVNSSHYLCSSVEGLTYCFFCLVLLVGFVCISVVVGDKDSFFR